MKQAWRIAVTGNNASQDSSSPAAHFADDCAYNQVTLKLLRYEEAARRSWYKALNQLRQMRAQNESLDALRQSRLAKQADLEANRLIAQALAPPIAAVPVPKQPPCETKPMPPHLQRELDAHKRRDPLFDPCHDRSQMSRELQKYFEKRAAWSPPRGERVS